MSPLSRLSSRVSAVAEQLVDPRVGIVRAVEVLKLEAGSPRFFHCSARACNLAACGLQASHAALDGASPDRESAAVKAIVEALRFYCAAFYDPEDLALTSSDDASFECAAPSTFALYAPEQHQDPDFPYEPFTGASQVRWAPAIDLGSGTSCHVPAAMVMAPYAPRPGSGEASIAPHTSTGLACACSAAEAAISAICSAVQDDAMALVWQARIAPPQIRVETLSDPGYELVARIEDTVGAVTLFDLSMVSGVPVVLAALRCKEPGSPALVCAGGAAPDPESAVRSALEDLALALHHSSRIKAHAPPLEPTGDHRGVVDQAGHLRFWCDHTHAPLADHLFGSKERVDFDALPDLSSADPRECQRALVDTIRAAGHQALFVDLTTRDLRDLGLVVARVVVPGLQPLFMGHRLRALGGSRVREASRRLGRPSAAGADAPHPYLMKGSV